MAIIKRKNKSGKVIGWFAVVNYVDEAGNRRQRRKAAKTEDEAKLREAELVVSKASGVSLVPDKTTVAEYLAKWLDHATPDLGGRTVQNYEQLIRNHIVPVIGNIKLRQLRPLDVEAVKKRMAERGRSGTTIHHAFYVLRGALQQALKWELVTRNVADAVAPP